MSTLFDDEELIRARQQRDTAVDVANHAVAKVSRVLETVAILRSEVLAWRDGCTPDKANTPEQKQAIKEAMSTTDAAAALEDE